MISRYIIGGLGLVVVVLTLALTAAGNAYLNQRDANRELVMTARITALTAEAKADKEAALKELREEYDALIADTDTAHKDRENEILAQLLTAQNDASQKPVAFGDDLIRDIIRIDCLWALGAAANNSQGRAACSDEAANADTTRSGLSFSALTSEFLIGWRDACEDWGLIRPGSTGDLAYTEDMWLDEYTNFDTALCRETLIAFTPQASFMLRRFIENGENYSARLLNHAAEQARIIDTLAP